MDEGGGGWDFVAVEGFERRLGAESGVGMFVCLRLRLRLLLRLYLHLFVCLFACLLCLFVCLLAWRDANASVCDQLPPKRLFPV
jgi:hypothetical protein